MAWINKIKKVSIEKTMGAAGPCVAIHVVKKLNKAPSSFATTGNAGAKKSGSFTAIAKSSKSKGA